MKFRTVLIIGLAIRLAIAPFFAHPFDVYVWYVTGQNFVSGRQPFWSYLVPYGYSFFLFVFPATIMFNVVSKFIQTFTLQMSSLNPILNPGATWNITVVPGLLFDLLVKLVLIVSDTLTAFVLYKIVLKYIGSEKSAVMVSALWLLNPLTIWVSSGWGMFDTLPTLFTVVALYLLLQKKFELAGVSIALAIAMKYYAVVLIVPLLILALQNGGKVRAAKTIIYTSLTGTLFFLPYINGVIYGFNVIVVTASSGQLHYSGLSFWTALTLFYADFNQTLISTLLIVAALAICYVWTWKHRQTQYFARLSAISFFLPVLSLLLFFRFADDNFFIWILPFIAILSIKDIWVTRLYWILSIVVLISSMTDSLLIYYMLPMSPWIGGLLAHMLSVVSPYRVAPAGNIIQGISMGKVFLATLGILSFIISIILVLEFVHSKRLDVASVPTS